MLTSKGFRCFFCEDVEYAPKEIPKGRVYQCKVCLRSIPCPTTKPKEKTMKDNVSINKQYKTLDGRQVRIYAVEDKGFYPVHGAILDNGQWISHCWTLAGSVSSDRNQYLDDLVEARPKVKVKYYVNIFQKENPELQWASIHSTKESSDKYPEGRIARILIEREVEHGEGL